jgi:type VI secretion system protein ImpL
MKIPPWWRTVGAVRWHGPALVLAWLLLATWAAGLLLAATQLGNWRQELTRTLTQLNADAYFRARVQDRDAVDPEWYRRKALALISATERLQRDTLWTLFLPGSWTAFDRLEEQVQARLEREFADIVVETVRRQLHARTASLTGVPLAPGTGELQAGAECQSPVPQNVERRLSAAAEDLPEFVAVADYVAGIERLDAAVQSFFSLQYSGGEPEQLRKLLAFTLGKEVPGALAGSVRMFQGHDEVSVQPGLMRARLQWATRCSLGKAMAALHTRLLDTNDLLALEQGLVERSTGLFEASARQQAPFDRTLERYRAVHALLEDQHLLLAKGRHDWMRQASLQLGPAYQDVIRRIERTSLLGPEVVQQLRNQSGASFAEFRRQFEQAFGSRGQPGIVWVEGEQRYTLSGERAALREGLSALLKASFMAEEPPAATKPARESGTLGKALQEARVLAAERGRVLSEVLPLFPPQTQPVVARVVDARVSELVYQRAYRALKAALPADATAPVDTALLRQQRDQVAGLQAVLKETGGAGLGERLAATLDGELLRRLAVLQDEWNQHPLLDARASDFAWWQGDALPLAQVLGAAEAPAGAVHLGRTAARFEQSLRQAEPLLALGSAALSTDAAAARWLSLRAELERYAARSGDSSLVRLERYVGALGADLRRDNCGERLAAVAPATAGDDEIAQRHLQVHQALWQRCQQLRAQAAAPGESPTQ